MGPGYKHLIATGQGHAEAWSSCPTACCSASRGRQHREERGCQPAHSPLFPKGLALWHQASNPLCPGTSVSSGPGEGGEGNQGRFRPERQGPQWPVARASSRSCCIQGWPDVCRGHRPQVETGAQPPRRAARIYGRNGAGTITSGRDCTLPGSPGQGGESLVGVWNWGPGRGWGMGTYVAGRAGHVAGFSLTWICDSSWAPG